MQSFIRFYLIEKFLCLVSFARRYFGNFKTFLTFMSNKILDMSSLILKCFWLCYYRKLEKKKTGKMHAKNCPE